MAASKSYFPRANFKFLPKDQGRTTDSTVFELDESDVWNSEADSYSPKSQKPSSIISRTPPPPVGGSASMPVKVPDWSKILKDEYREKNRRRDSDDDDYDEENRLPPHELLARSKMTSFSVQEGVGRTLKGRDLSRVRNAIWQKIGFED
ncbi:hypothetical protein CDL12_01699 [Handroanthus impetiginosus]|uniref:Senescence regulator S40 n=1 Tax=Handroanthus impetiginosus TaxID=429701 RepID=A0A2G9I717_9LAMI|nr:hypothetical protein CDL12_01699 [Handroanthus impetiginosus]